MKEYRVSWVIDISADSPLDAAEEAYRIQQKPDSWATVFVVQELDSTRKWQVDLDADPGEEVVQL